MSLNPSITCTSTVASTHPTTSSEDCTPLAVRVISDEKSWFAMRDEWNELLEDSVYPNIFLRWEWQTAWWDSFGEDRSMRILLVEQDGVLLGIAPLYHQTAGVPAVTRRTSLFFIGYGGPLCPEYLGPIIRKGYVGQVSWALVDHLFNETEKWDELFLEEYALDDPGTTIFVDLLRAKFPCITIPGEPRYYISLPSSYDEYLATLSGHNRQKKRNRIRQASKKHNFQLARLSPDTIDDWFPHVTQLSGKSCLRGGKISPFYREDYSGFQRHVLSQLMPQGFADVFLLYFDDQPVAFWYLLRYHDKYYGYQTGFDDTKRGSPGDVALQLVLMSAIEDEAKEFDFLRGKHSYKKAYTSLLRQTQSANLFRTRNKVFAIRWVMNRLVYPACVWMQRLFRRGL